MSRNEKLLTRRVELEQDFVSQLREHLERVIETRDGWFFRARRFRTSLSPRSQKEPIEGLLALGDEVVGLNEKLGEPPSAAVMALHETCRYESRRDPQRLGPRRLAERLLGLLGSLQDGSLQPTGSTGDQSAAAGSSMLATRYRTELVRGLSFIGGAAELSEALAGVPQLAELGLLFHGHESRGFAPHLGQEAFARSIGWSPAERGYLELLSASYSRGHYYAWSLTVYAVPSRLRHKMRSLLPSCIASIRAWLVAERPPTWYEGTRTVSCGGAVEPEMLCLVETHGERIVECREQEILAKGSS